MGRIPLHTLNGSLDELADSSDTIVEKKVPRGYDNSWYFSAPDFVEKYFVSDGSWVASVQGAFAPRNSAPLDEEATGFLYQVMPWDVLATSLSLLGIRTDSALDRRMIDIADGDVGVYLGEPVFLYSDVRPVISIPRNGVSAVRSLPDGMGHQDMMIQAFERANRD